MPAQVSIPVHHSSFPPDASSEAAKEPGLLDENARVDCDDTDPFDLSRARPEEHEDLFRTESSDKLAISFSLKKLLTERWLASFCQTVLPLQSGTKDVALFEDD